MVSKTWVEKYQMSFINYRIGQSEIRRIGIRQNGIRRSEKTPKTASHASRMNGTICKYITLVILPIL